MNWIKELTLGKSNDKNTIYTYWVSRNNEPIPAYLKMCLKTWSLFIPNLKLVVINHDNLHDFISSEINVDNFKRLSLAQQSDVVSVATLAQRGGVFMDLDTIITGDVTDVLFTANGTKVKAFGDPIQQYIHLAIMWSGQPGNKLLGEWYKRMKIRLNSMPDNIPWDYVGNAIVNELLKDKNYQGEFEIIDRTASGNIIESAFDKDADTYRAYIKFWFGEQPIEIDRILEKVSCNLISLHNSWTPKEFKAASLPVVASCKVNLSRLLSYLLLGNQAIR